eukprot:CAMPEP_0170382260 /NCGR_PEP_ID=MMETSP0117_2-20130122/14849_1 /TAXON_ID=400756 /ORGANISM="Durinskia baltica, Strain CSIRO CS-38" /LENGTH=1656 /DNA_ID=CAMNT_0010637889 /DNA_START=260 /DNA_END=5230 /DNA_ORIENTATION=+
MTKSFGSPRSRTKAKAISWLKNLLQETGCVIFEGEANSHTIDKCFQVAVPSLQKYCASMVRENNSSGILNSLTFEDILKNICALRSEYVMRIGKPILQKLMSHDRNRNTFNQPVDPVELGIPHYFQVVTQPMDLGTVLSKLRAGKYYTIKACFDDVELVFKNAMLFNHSSHEVHKMARDLLQEFRTEVAQAEEKCVKEKEKRSQHSCSLCCGSTCQLCGEKCLKYEAPSLNCQQCGTRIKKNGIFYVCADGSALWCQKCYMALPPVISPGAPRPLHECDSQAELITDGRVERGAEFDSTKDGIQCSEEISAPCAQTADPVTAVSTCDSDSIHEPTSGSGSNSFSYNSNSNSFGDGKDAPLLKKHLLKRRADEEVAEPWVACDSCGNWYHQICALYSQLGDAEASEQSLSFCCPFCVLLAGSQQVNSDLSLTLGESLDNSCCPRRRGSGCDETAVVSSECAAVLPHSEIPSRVETETENEITVSVVGRTKVGLTVKFEADALFKNIFEYSELASPREGNEPGLGSSSDDCESMDVIEDNRRVLALDVDVATTTVTSSGVANVSANSSCAGNGMTSEDERLMDDESVHEVCRSRTESTEQDTSIVLSSTTTSSQDHPISGASGFSIPPPPSEARRTVSGALSVEGEALPCLKMKSTHHIWRASSLPRTKLGDFLESLVQDLLIANNYPDAARTITIRMTTNKDMSLEVPTSIVQNLVSPSGHIIPECMGYKQKCILLFQEVDGVDVCIFSLYVHEFDANCPSPNTSTVYIAYLDSVDYFRPVTARTMVYQEIVAGYLKWSQARGFKQAHIWSCPPHRGDNFIFNAHPVHQKYPSRERLNHWYKSILGRCSKLGIIAETGNLWQQYFSKYVRRDSLPAARQAALNSFVGSGKAVRKNHMRPKPKLFGAAATSAAGAPTAKLTEDKASKSAATIADACAAPLTASMLPSKSVFESAPTVASMTAAPAPLVDTPVCPPIFDGDYWVQQYVYLVRLHTQKGKSQNTTNQRQQLGLRKFREILKRLMNRDESAPFLHPVDHIALNIPTYPVIVKAPMDMTTVKEKLGSGEYPSAFEFVKDVRLIFSNAKLFNHPEHAVHIAADFVSLKFERSLALALAELREMSGNGLLRMPIPGAPDQNDAESVLKGIPLSFPCKEGRDSREVAETSLSNHSATTETGMPPSLHERMDVDADTVVVSKAEEVQDREKEKENDHVYMTPECKAVSRSGSVIEERDFWATDVLCPNGISLNGQRSRAQSISVTPTTTSAAFTGGALVGADATISSVVLLPSTTESREVEAVSDLDLEADVDHQRDLQHVVSQDFSLAARVVRDDGSCSDDKRKRIELTNAIYSSPEGASKRRRLSDEIVTAPEHTICDAASIPVSASAPSIKTDFSADAVNLAHQPVAFSAPALGSQNAMTIVAELSKRMQRQYDDLFVIKLAPPTASNLFNDVVANTDASVLPNVPLGPPAAPSKKPRGRVALVVKKTPAMHIPGGLKAMGNKCRAFLSTLTPDTADPDPSLSSPVTDSRHVFLELCQFRHYQFDSLRRAKHSTLMLLYHLRNPHDKRCHPCCSNCDEVIQTLRWHCDECPNFDLCGSCYTADMSRRTGPLCLSHRTSFSIDVADAFDPLSDHHDAPAGQINGESALSLPHPHVLTPYRVSSN